MSNYSEKLVLGEDVLFLDEAQRKYIEFERKTLQDKYNRYLQIAKNEAEMQYFFEINPMFIPGLFDLHNGPIGNIVITKLKLAEEFITDFAFISVNSATAQITLVEIESPKMEIFRKSDNCFSSKFNLAQQQLRDWGTWAHQNPTYIKDLFRKIYHRSIFKYRSVYVRRILIAGRREEINKNSRREQRWAGINSDPYSIVMSYDRVPEIFTLNSRTLQRLICRPTRYVSEAMKR